MRPKVRKAAAETPPARTFVLAFATGVAWTFGPLYSGKVSALLLTGGWAWAPFSAEVSDPLAVLGAALLPCAVLLCFARPALGRHLFGSRPRPGESWGTEQLPRLAGLGLALVLFLVLGGAS